MTRGTRILAVIAAVLILPLLSLSTISAQDYGDPGSRGPDIDYPGACQGNAFACLFIFVLGSLGDAHRQYLRDRCGACVTERQPSYQLVRYPAVATTQPSVLPIDPKLLQALDLMYWDTGAIVSQADRAKGLDVVASVVTIDRTGLGVELTTDPAVPQATPLLYRLVFDVPGTRGGPQNRFSGPGFEEDVVVQARADAPGRFALSAIVGGRERQVQGTVQSIGGGVRITLPGVAVADLGLASPGVRAVFGTVGPAPERVYARVPERGAIQLGLPGRETLDSAALAQMAKTRFDLTGDGKDDLFYLDTNGNGQIDAVALDRNNDGRIELARLEGPGLFVGADGAPLEFAQVVRQVAGAQQRYILENAQMVYITIFEDKNGDRRFSGPGEFESYGALK